MEPREAIDAARTSMAKAHISDDAESFDAHLGNALIELESVPDCAAKIATKDKLIEILAHKSAPRRRGAFSRAHRDMDRLLAWEFHHGVGKVVAPV